MNIEPFPGQDDLLSSLNRLELIDKIKLLEDENKQLKKRQGETFFYIRQKVDQLLQVIGTVPLKPEELDDDTLIELDPIGIVSDSFVQVIEHLNDTNEALRFMHDELQAIFDSAPIGIVVLDINRQIINCNDHAAQHLLKGESEVIGRACYDVICYRESPSHPCVMQRAIDGNTTCRQLEWLIDDHYYDVIATPVRDEKGAISSVVVVFVDVTTQKRLDEEMSRSLKLESLGLLAGGLAHDFNNFLAAILNNVTLARIHSKPGDKVYEWMQKTEKAASRAQHLTLQLLTFAKGGSPVIREMSIEKLVRDSAQFSLSGSNVDCEFIIPSDLKAVKIDPGQIDQVVRNLIINSNQAMPDGGKIEVSCYNRKIDENESSVVAAGDYVVLKIKDNGAGIEPQVMAKIFDPYFTTKDSGSGLGLAISYAIIGKHQGHIAVESELGVGTTFEILLPATDSIELPEVVKEMKSTNGSGRILVMDDDEIVCETTSELLGYLGYKVESANDGRQAIQLYQAALEQQEPIDVVILDLTVPGGMGGEETIKELLRIDSEVVAIATSGYCNNPVMANYLDYGFKGVLPKPCKIEAMQQVIEELI